MKHLTYSLMSLLFVALLMSCGGRTRSTRMAPDTLALTPCPRFSPDSALRYIKEQCAFGPRVPGSRESERCGDYLVEQFRCFGAEVEEQRTTVKRYDGEQFPARNIIARVNPSATDRVLVCAHWDSRPWADNDPNERNHHKPILGANDGASGVAVMLELCRLMQLQPIAIGADLVCFDAEDMGVPEWDEDFTRETSGTWCLGSLYWAEQAAKAGYKARYGVLLDMVGGRGCTFAREQVSRYFAEPVVNLLWTLAGQLGYRHYFPLTDGGYLTDDHVNVNRIARIPCIDVVPYFNDGPSSFGPTWHTVDDTPENIDPNVLEAVGQSLTQMLYNER